jgi:hypothetical protein
MDDSYEASPKRNLGGPIPNILTAVMLLLTLGAGSVLGAMFLNPYLAFNPYPPPTLPVTLAWPTKTNTPEIYLPPTWTPTVGGATAGPTATETPLPPSETPTVAPGTSETPTGGEVFDFAASTPLYLQNIQNLEGCNWLGVGGQVFDTNGAPILGLTVHLEGEVGGSELISTDALTGSDEFWGPGGYTITIHNHPLALDQTLWMQLIDTASGLPLSDRFYLSTYDDCMKNSIMLNWSQLP